MINTAGISPDTISKATSNLSNENTIAVLSKLSLSDAENRIILKKKRLEGEELSSALAAISASAASNNAARSVGNLSLIFQGLGAQIKTTASALWAFLSTTPAGWATMAAGAMAALTAGIYAYHKSLDTAVIQAKDKLSVTSSDLADVTRQIGETTSRISELETLSKNGQLSITDKEDLEQLKKQNQELSVRQQYLEKQKAHDENELVEAAKKKYDHEFGSENASRESIEAYKEQLSASGSTPSSAPNAYISGNSPTMPQIPYAAGQQAQELETEADNLSALIAKYEVYAEKRQKAYEAGDTGLGDKYSQKLSTVEQKLIDTRFQLQDFSDDLSLTGVSSAELDDVTNKLKLIDSTLLVSTDSFRHFMSSSLTSEKQKALVELARSGNLTTETLASDFDVVDSFMKNNGQTLGQLTCMLKDYGNELDTVKTPASSGGFMDYMESTKPALESLKTAYQDIFTLEDGQELFSLEGLDASVLSGLQDAFGNVEGFDTFLDTITNMSSTSEQVHGAFNDLAVSFLSSKETMDGLSISTSGLLTEQLSMLGMTNAQQLVTDSLNAKTQALALQEQVLALTKNGVTAATAGQINALLSEAGASDTARLYLFQLAAEEQIFNNQDLDTQDKIAKLKELAESYGETAIAAKIARIEEQAAKDGTDPEETYEAIAKEINNAVSNVSAPAPSNVPSGFSASGAAAADAWLDAYQKEMDELEHARSMEYTTDAAYYQKLNELNEAYFNDSLAHQQKYLDKYRSNQEKIYMGLRDLYVSQLQEEQKGMDAALSAVAKRFDQEIRSLEKQKAASASSYQDQIDHIDDKIKKLEQQKKKEQEALQSQIDANQKLADQYQEQIDALQDKNDAIDRQKALEEALFQQQRARNQRTVRQFDGKEFTYAADTDALREADESVRDASLAIQIAELASFIDALETSNDSLKEQMDEIDEAYAAQIEALEEKQDSLKGKIDEVNASYDAQIETLNGYKDQWSEISSAYTDDQNQMMASLLLGAGWEAAVLGGRLNLLAGFKDGYLAVSDELKQVQGGLGISSDPEEYEESIARMLLKTQDLEEVLQSWQDLNSGLGNVIGVGGSGEEGEEGEESSGSASPEGGGSSDSITGAVTAGGEMVSDILSSQWIPAFQTFGSGIDGICRTIVADVDEMNAGIVKSCRNAIKALQALANAKAGGSFQPVEYEHVSYVGSGQPGAAPALAGGRVALEKDMTALTGEQGAEGLVRDGQFRLIGRDGAEMNRLKKGDIIFNARQTRALLQNGRISGRGRTVGGFADGTLSESLSRFTMAQDAVVDNLSQRTSSAPLSSCRPVQKNMIFNGDLSFPNITRGGDAEKLIKTLQKLPHDARTQF